MEIAPGFSTLNDDERQYPATPAKADGFPDGWLVRRVPQQGNGNRIKSLFYSPKLNLKFRTKVDVKRYLECLREADGNEAAATKLVRQRKHCAKINCSNIAIAGGLCRKHGPRCVVVGCDNDVHARKMCRGHHQIAESTSKNGIHDEVVASGNGNSYQPSSQKKTKWKIKKERAVNNLKTFSRNTMEMSKDSEIKSSTMGNREQLHRHPHPPPSGTHMKFELSDSESTTDVSVLINDNWKGERNNHESIVDLTEFESLSSLETDIRMSQNNGESNKVDASNGQGQKDSSIDHHQQQEEQRQRQLPSSATHNKLGSRWSAAPQDFCRVDNMAQSTLDSNPTNTTEQRRHADVSLPPTMKAQLVKLIPQKCEQNNGVCEGDIWGKIKGFVAACQGVACEAVLKKNFPNELHLELVDGKKRYFFRDCSSPVALSKEVEVDVTENMPPPQQRQMKIQQEKKKNTTQEVEVDKLKQPIMSDEVKAIIMSHIPTKENGIEGVSLAFIMKEFKRVRHYTYGRKTFEDNLRDEIEIEKVDGTTRYFLASGVKMSDEMKATIMSHIPIKTDGIEGVSLGFIMRKYKPLSRSRFRKRKVFEYCLRDEIEIEKIDGTTRYFVASDAFSKEAEVDVTKNVQQQQQMEIQLGRKNNTTQEVEVDNFPKMWEEMKTTILSHIPLKGNATEGSTLGFIIKQCKLPRRSINKRKSFEKCLREEIEIEKVDGTTRYFLASKGIVNQGESNDKQHGESGLHPLPVSVKCGEGNESGVMNQETYNSECDMADSSRQKDAVTELLTKEKLIELTASQSADTKFPPGCQVTYDHKAQTDAFKMGVVKSVSISLKGNFVYKIKPTASKKKKGEKVLVGEHTLAYAPATPIQFRSDNSTNQAGIVLQASRISGGDSCGLRYSVLTSSDNGEHVVQCNVSSQALSFRVISSTKKEIYGLQHLALPSSTGEKIGVGAEVKRDKKEKSKNKRKRIESNVTESVDKKERKKKKKENKSKSKSKS